MLIVIGVSHILTLLLLPNIIGSEAESMDLIDGRLRGEKLVNEFDQTNNNKIHETQKIKLNSVAASTHKINLWLSTTHTHQQ